MTKVEKLVSLRDAALTIFTRSLDECSVPRSFQARIGLRTDPTPALTLTGSEDVELSGVRRILVIALGKGARPMLDCLLEVLRPLDDLAIEGLLIAPDAPDVLPKGMRFFAGGHPLPNQASLTGGRAALQLLQEHAGNFTAAPHTLCLFLLSGGASSMFELPLDPTIGLDDVLAFHRTLIHSGAAIAEINCVRKHFSAVKGGRLALAAGGMRCLTIAVSDVPAGALDALGSGPTLPDNSTIDQCFAILEQYSLLPQFTPAVRDFFTSSRLIETPKPQDLLGRVYTLLSEEHLREAARHHAEELGFHVVVDGRCDDWDYQDAARYLIAQMRALRGQHPTLCLISSGEVTVHLDAAHGPQGSGGRNQQLALYAAMLLDASDDPCVLFSAGSDGIDGNSPAAGALIDSEMLVSPDSRQAATWALGGFDAYTLLASCGAAVTTGRTGNNLRDLRLLLTFQ